MARHRSNAKPRPMIRPHHPFEAEGGTELIGPSVVMEAIGHHIAIKSGYDGSKATQALLAAVSQIRAVALEGLAGALLRMTEEADTLPGSWAESRLAVIPMAPQRRRLAELHPIWLVPTWRQ